MGKRFQKETGAQKTKRQDDKGGLAQKSEGWLVHVVVFTAWPIPVPLTRGGVEADGEDSRTASPVLDVRALSDEPQNSGQSLRRAMGEAETAKGYLSIEVETVDLTKLGTTVIRNRKLSLL